jgi:hypothetical protein
MSRKLVGYFAGTDSTLLTKLICDGHDTEPISNGFDNHGRSFRSINEENSLDLLIGYLHKIYAPEGAGTLFEDVFHVCRIYRIPLLLEVPRELHERASELLKNPPGIVRPVDPADLLEAAREILRG